MFNKKWLQDKWEGIFNELMKDEKFRIFWEDPSEYNFEEWQYDPNNLMDKLDIRAAHGATRGIIYDLDCEVVFKIPFLGEEPDYSEKECRIYQKAVELGVAEQFTWTELVGRYQMNPLGWELPVYAMEFRRCDDDDMYGSLYDYCSSQWKVWSEERRKQYYDDWSGGYDEYVEDSDFPGLNDISEQMLDYALNDWGEPVYSKVYAILALYRVNDLHAGNWGWDDCGKLVLVDYAGYDN